MSDQIVAVRGGKATGPAEAVSESMRRMGYEPVPLATEPMNEGVPDGQAVMAFTNGHEALAVRIYGPVEVATGRAGLWGHRLRLPNRSEAGDQIQTAQEDCGRLVAAFDLLGLLGGIESVVGCVARVAMDPTYEHGRVKAAYNLANVRIG